ncbi:MAG TPA: RluA family pseudouridine synthase, partial [Roseiflexaceae bacterium]|nr:RluA family pseudouridine synthase [Roseiflexaceae bacterium]
MDTTPTIRLTIPPQHDGRPLRELVAEVLGDELDAVRLIERGGLWVDGARMRDVDARARPGTEVAIHRPLSGAYPEIEVSAAQIVYEDEDLLALNKPAGVYVDSTPWDAEGNYHAALLRFIAARDGTTPRLHLAHRLDRDTTGVLLVTKNPEMNPQIQAAFIHGRVSKQYLAMCAGAPMEDSFALTSGHGRGAHGLFRVYPAEEIGRVLVNGSRVKAMRTRFEVERRAADASLVRAFPETGRTHQIRLHLAYLDHPLIGDTRYGGPALWRGEP